MQLQINLLSLLSPPTEEHIPYTILGAFFPTPLLIFTIRTTVCYLLPDASSADICLWCQSRTCFIDWYIGPQVPPSKYNQRAGSSRQAKRPETQVVFLWNHSTSTWPSQVSSLLTVGLMKTRI